MHDRRPAAHGRRRADRRRPAARAPRACWARLRNATTTDARAALERRAGRGPGVAGPVVRRPRGGVPQGRRPAGRAVAATPSTPRRCSASSKTCYQAEIDAACELIDFWRFNVAFGRQILAEQPISSPGRVEPHRPPPARGLRVRDHAVQLHGDRRQPADGAGADGQHRRLEAGADPAARGALHDAAARGGRPAARRDQPGAPATARASPRWRSPTPTSPGIHFTGSTPRFQHLWRTVGGEHRHLPRLPADRGRDRRQGLRARAPVGRRRRAADGARPRRVRVPGPEVLGGLARVRAARRCGRGCGTTSSTTSSRLPMGPVTDFSNFLGAVIDERAYAKHVGRDRAGAADSAAPRSSPAATYDDSEGWFVRPTVILGERPDRRDVHAPSTSARSWRCTSTTTPTTTACSRQMESVVAVRADRLDHRPGPGGDRRRRRACCGSPPATSTSTTSRPAPSSASSRSAGRARRARTTRPARRRTCMRWTSTRSIKETFVPPTVARLPAHGLTPSACLAGDQCDPRRMDASQAVPSALLARRMRRPAAAGSSAFSMRPPTSGDGRLHVAVDRLDADPGPARGRSVERRRRTAPGAPLIIDDGRAVAGAVRGRRAPVVGPGRRSRVPPTKARANVGQPGRSASSGGSLTAAAVVVLLESTPRSAAPVAAHLRSWNDSSVTRAYANTGRRGSRGWRTGGATSRLRRSGRLSRRLPGATACRTGGSTRRGSGRSTARVGAAAHGARPWQRAREATWSCPTPVDRSTAHRCTGGSRRRRAPADGRGGGMPGGAHVDGDRARRMSTDKVDRAGAHGRRGRAAPGRSVAVPGQRYYRHVAGRRTSSGATRSTSSAPALSHRGSPRAARRARPNVARLHPDASTRRLDLRPHRGRDRHRRHAVPRRLGHHRAVAPGARDPPGGPPAGRGAPRRRPGALLEVLRRPRTWRAREHPRDSVVESWMHVEIDRETDAPSGSRRIRGGAAPGAARRPRGGRGLAEDERGPPAPSPSELAAAPPPSVPRARRSPRRGELLRWLADDHFTFLGYREYDLSRRRRATTACVAVPGTGLGILRYDQQPDRRAFDRCRRRPARKAREPHMLVLTKANTRSTVHRSAYLDYVGVKRFDADGDGRSASGGSSACSPRPRTPRASGASRCCAARSREVLERSGFRRDSHTGKDLLQILETYPRDELFQISVDELLRRPSLAVLHLQERRQTRLFLRRDDYGRFMSCLVYLPRDRYTTTVRLRDGARSCARRSARRTVDYTRPGDRVGAGPAALRRAAAAGRADARRRRATSSRPQLVEATRSWADDFADALVDQCGEEEAARLLRSYGDAFPEAYKEDFPARAAVADLRRLEALAAATAPMRGSNLYEPARRGPERAPVQALPARRAAVAVRGAAGACSSMGVEVVDERPVRDRARRTAPGVDLRLRAALRRRRRAEHRRRCKVASFQDAFAAAWSGARRERRLQRAGAARRARPGGRRGAARLREVPAPGRLDVQPGLHRAVPARRTSSVARLLVRLFEARFDPDVTVGRPRAAASSTDARRGDPGRARRRRSLDQDRILRSFLALVQATLRTNCVPARRRRRAASRTCRSSSTRARFPTCRSRGRSSRSGCTRPRVEGVHLRFGAVARGGLRWSDRREDFRTEVLGLVKAQAVKNAVIVPDRRQGRLRRQARRPTRQRPRGVAGRGHRVLPDVHRGAARRHRQPRRRRGRRRRRSTSCATTATTPTSSSRPTRARRRSPTSPTTIALDVRLLARRRVRVRRLGRLRPQGDGHHRARRVGVGASGTSASSASTPRPQDFTVVGVGDMSRRRVRQRHAAVGAHPARRRVRPPARVPRPDPGPGRVVRRAAPAVRRCRARRGPTTTPR